MNGIEKITQRIAQGNDSEVQAMLLEAKAQADAITAEYETKAAEQYRAIVEKGEKDAADRIERLGSVAQLEARKLRLAAKQEMLGKAFSTAQDRLLSLSGEEYIKLLTTLALRAVSKGTEALVFSTADRNTYGKKVVIAANAALEAQGRTAALTLSEESREFKGGLYVKDGNIETNCTFATLIRLQKEKMSGEVAAILFA